MYAFRYNFSLHCVENHLAIIMSRVKLKNYRIRKKKRGIVKNYREKNEEEIQIDIYTRR